MTIRMGSKAEREIFWLDDPANLFTKDTWTRFVPTNDMTVPEALNAVVRFSLYFSFLMSFITGNANYLLFVPVILMLSVVLVKVYPETQILKEAFNNKDHTKFEKPKQSNPFMNVLFTDYVDNVNRPPAPHDINAPDVKESIFEAFSKPSDILMDTSDKLVLAQSARDFVTQASTTIPNDLGAFQDFLNKDNVSRKELSEGYAVAKGSRFE
jgi:hypothetical protein